MSSVMALPIVDATSDLSTVPDGIIPIRSGGSCGSGCGTHSETSENARLRPPEGEQVVIPFSQRKLNLNAVPTVGMDIVGIDMDLTVECNLRCTYCFKEKWNEHMEEEIAFDTIVWLIHASGMQPELHVAFMGGEPLIRFKLIKKLVPFAKRRAAQENKTIHFSMTTNGTLVTDEVVRFWKEWGLAFHTSIDGPPDIQDVNRPTTGGQGSSRLLERAVPKILDYQQNTCARCTVVPGSAGSLVRSYKYFRSLGYRQIAFVPGGQPEWDAKSIKLFEDQFREVADLAMDDIRAGIPVSLKGVDEFIRSAIRGSRYSHPCGAARGLVLVDIKGDIWPCHRWNKKSEFSWQIGSIYEQFNDAIRAPLDNKSFVDLLEMNCPSCVANKMCSGGCPAENLEHTGSVYRRHPNSCELTRAWARVGQYVMETMQGESNPTYHSMYYATASS